MKTWVGILGILCFGVAHSEEADFVEWNLFRTHRNSMGHADSHQKISSGSIRLDEDPFMPKASLTLDLADLEKECSIDLPGQGAQLKMRVFYSPYSDQWVAGFELFNRRGRRLRYGNLPVNDEGPASLECVTISGKERTSSCLSIQIFTNS